MYDFVTRTESTRGLAASQTITNPQAEADAQSASPAPPQDEIERRAYEIYTESGCRCGHCSENWEQAERELRQASETKDPPQRDVETSEQDEDYEPVVRTFPDAIHSVQRGGVPAHGVSPRGPHGNLDAVP